MDQIDRYGHSALWKAASNGHLPIVQYLVEQGADKEKTYGSNTPLMNASWYGHLDVVRYLLEQGADREKKSIIGYTSLHCAAQNGYLEMAMLLMSYGADLNALNNKDKLPIDLAATEEIRQAIHDEPRRRMDHGHKRATEQDRHPIAAAATSANAQQKEAGEEVEEENSNQKPDLGQEAAVTEDEAKILAEINEDSEPSDEEDD